MAYKLTSHKYAHGPTYLDDRANPIGSPSHFCPENRNPNIYVMITYYVPISDPCLTVNVDRGVVAGTTICSTFIATYLIIFHKTLKTVQPCKR
jgi:hypothetical protein